LKRRENFFETYNPVSKLCAQFLFSHSTYLGRLFFNMDLDQRSQKNTKPSERLISCRFKIQ
jgi:hypothetical protein